MATWWLPLVWGRRHAFLRAPLEDEQDGLHNTEDRQGKLVIGLGDP